MPCEKSPCCSSVFGWRHSFVGQINMVIFFKPPRPDPISVLLETPVFSAEFYSHEMIPIGASIQKNVGMIKPYLSAS